MVFTVVPKSAAKVSRGAKPLQKRAGGEASARLETVFHPAEILLLRDPSHEDGQEEARRHDQNVEQPRVHLEADDVVQEVDEGEVSEIGL